MRIAAILTALATSISTTSFAIPDPSGSTCPPVVLLGDGGSGCCFDVVVRDFANNPIAGSVVRVDFGACAVTLCPIQPPGITAGSNYVETVTNALGVAHFCVCGTLMTPPCNATITADGINLCSVAVDNCSATGVPLTMSYQGVLTDGSGAIPPDGPYDFTFRIYDDPVLSGGHLLWSEDHDAVPVSRGGFGVILGMGTPAVPLALAFDAQYYLGISVNGGAELSPRVKLASSPYSLIARSVANGAVTNSSIAAGQVVKSLNGLHDDVTLAAGANVSITSTGQTVTIAAPSGIKAWGLVKVTTGGVITLINGFNVASVTNGGTFLTVNFSHPLGTRDYAVLVQDGRPASGGFPANLTYEPDFFDGQRDSRFFLLRQDSIGNWGAPPRDLTFSFMVVGN